MRFAEEFRRSQSPQWSLFYITYDSLKISLKIEHGKSKAQRKESDLGALLDNLVRQCETVEKLYLSECSRLSLLQSQLLAALDAIAHVDRQSSPEMVFARQKLAGAAVSYISDNAKLLILFAKVNTDAAFRILDKLNRVREIELVNGKSELPRFDFFSASSICYTFDWARKTLPTIPEVDTVSQSIWAENANAILEPLLSNIGADANEQSGFSKGRLSLLIQLAGFHKSSCVQSPDTLSKYKSGERGTESLSNVVCSIIEELALDNDPSIFFEPDNFGRSQLHYAAEHGLEDIVSKLLGIPCDVRYKPVSIFCSIEPEARQISPLGLAICSGNRPTISTMLQSIRELSTSSDGTSIPLPPRLARKALEMGDMTTLTSILSFGTEINDADDRGQLLLNAAIRSMPDACQTLLKHGAKVNLVEPATGRTALCLACIRGDVSLVTLLLDYGALPSIQDWCGWLPIEHAAYRGYFPVMKVLVSMDGYDASSTLSTVTPMCTVPLTRTDMMKASHIPWMQDHPEDFTGDYVWLRLGNNDATNPVRGLQLHGPYDSETVSSYADEVLYTVRVSVHGSPQIAKEWTLPILESGVNAPWLFEVDSIKDLKLLWRLFAHSPNEATGRRLVGSGICLMGTLNQGSRQNRESLVRDTTVPLLEPLTSSFVGSVTFTYFWSTSHPPPKRLQEPHYWEFGNGIGGHRGSGKNKIDDKKLQIGENTAQSFSTAISHGASFLEFDVQLTKDLVPVVYHDFLISETGTDSPMHSLSYDQFKHLSSMQAPKRTRGSRSNSLESADNGHLETLQERMNHTYFNKVNGYKANTRGNFIHEKSCSLEEVFNHVPKSVPMNIELKYPMLFETDEWDMELLAIKTDIFADTVLDKVYEHAEGRTIVFSSFSPEICIALSTKQRTFPVFFLSKTAAPRGEVRSAGIQQAVHFAKSWGLPGIVTECTPLIYCPRLIQYVKSAGLAITSFGMGNSTKENVKIQFDGGINAVISDSIRAIKEIRDIAEGKDGPESVRVYP